MKQFNPLKNYWGKADSDQGKLNYLSIWEHSLNVVAVAKVWLAQRPLLLSRWTQLLGLDEKNAPDRASALSIALHCILLHDLGKYDWRFQRKVPSLFNKLNDLELKEIKKSFDHGGWGLHYYGCLKSGSQRFAINELPWYHLIRATTSHHGSYCPQRKDLTPRRRDEENEEQILQVIQQHLEMVEKLYPLPEKPPKPIDPAMVVFLAGLCSIVDWLGSDQKIFTTRAVDDLSEQPAGITEKLEEKAEQVLNQNGFLGKYKGNPEKRLERILGKDSPRPLQTQALAMSLTEHPQLIIMEAPMGEGKTEAAMLMTDRLFEMGVVDNFYFALPTMATSNAMFERIKRMMANEAFFDKDASLVLAHGKRDLIKTFTQILTANPSEGDDETENLSALKMCNEFFASSHKRSLLANAGVGTVDQAMSSVLGAKHHWVKLFGLSNSVLIIDEVHAYDAYMLRILERLLQWLRVLGTHVILLSATLTVQTRKDLIEAFSKRKIEAPSAIEENPFQAAEEDPMAYPLITHVYREGDAYKTNLIPNDHMKDSERDVRFKWVTQKDQIIESIVQFVQNGAQVCLILNTVGKAQEFFEILSQDSRIQNPLLFHSRFQLTDRNEIEETVESIFGKEGQAKRGEIGHVLVATQVVEQSLDVDFDVMLSELAPIDLLLQRVGRLHRHQANNEFRQGKDWKQPALFVYSPCETISEWLEGPKSKKARSVYDAFILYRTALLFHKQEYKFPVNLPGDIRCLVEEVYSGNDDAVLKEDQGKYEEAKLKWEEKTYQKKQLSSSVYQPAPDDEPKRLGKCEVRVCEAGELEEDLEAGGTRLIQPSIQIFFVDLAWTLKIDGREPGNESYRKFKQTLQRHSVTVLESMLAFSHGNYLQSEHFNPAGWPDSEQWRQTLERFEQEFIYQKPEPLILPLAEVSEEVVEYHFKQRSLVLKYSKQLGLQILK